MKSNVKLPVTKIVHVGDVGADSDMSMRAALARWIIENRPHLFKARQVKHTFIDLHKGKDFLTDRGRYDVVALHYLFGPPDDRLDAVAHLREQMGGNDFLISRRHSRDNWRNRLLQTGAEVIVAFGGGTEVSRAYLGDLPGYDVKTYHQPGTYSVYTKSSPS